MATKKPIIPQIATGSVLPKAPASPMSFINTPKAPVLPTIAPVGQVQPPAPATPTITPPAPTNSGTSLTKTANNSPVTPTITPTPTSVDNTALIKGLGDLSKGLGELETPKAPATPATDFEKAYQTATTPTAEESATEAELGKLRESARMGYMNTAGQAIPLEFITGQLKSIEGRATTLAEPLQDKLSRLQAARTSALNASKFALERADKQAEKAKPVSVSEGATLVDPTTGKPIYQAPYKPEKPKGDSILSVTEAQALGVPYGTTESQAYGKRPTGKPTVDESKARGFAVSASNADKILNTVDYNPGMVESSLTPNIFKSSERQQFEQASRAFINSVLRRESGATITDDEFKNKYKELIPQAGDGAEVIAQKKNARIAAVQSIREAGGNIEGQDQVGSQPKQFQLKDGSVVTLQADGTYK